MSHPPETAPTRIIRSHRRRRTVSARLVAGEVVVRVPSGMSEAELAPLVEQLRGRLLRRLTQRRGATPEDLESACRRLNERYFEGRLAVRSITWTAAQRRRHGSCNPRRQTILISRRLAELPSWVRDYVIVHELAHLLEPNHGPAFWRLVARFPLAERARGYLQAVDAGSGRNDN